MGLCVCTHARVHTRPPTTRPSYVTSALKKHWPQILTEGKGTTDTESKGLDTTRFLTFQLLEISSMRELGMVTYKPKGKEQGEAKGRIRKRRTTKSTVLKS